jgi:hypothetical protein
LEVRGPPETQPFDDQFVPALGDPHYVLGSANDAAELTFREP